MDTTVELKPVSPAALAAYRKHKTRIVENVVARALEQPAEVAQHGDDAERIVTAGIEFTAQVLESVMQVGDPALLDYQLSWAQDRLPHDGVSPAFVLSRFRNFADSVAQTLAPEHAQEVNQWVNWLINRQQALVNAAA